VIALALGYLILHLPSLAPSLEDIDSINFALGLRDYDIARHQPHPPGYPVYIALGRISYAAIAAVAPRLPLIRSEALALAIWSAIGGAIALWAAAAFYAALLDRAGPRRQAAAWTVWAAALLAVTPLFWVSGLRPMSDMPGLAAALTAQALLLRGFGDRRALIGGAVVAGLAIGIRSQTALLTLPLLAAAFVAQRRSGVWWLTRPLAALLAAAFAWAVPMVTASGGVSGYRAALGTQAGEDFAWVDMLLFNPAPRRLATALFDTFVLPWGTIEVGIAALVVAAAGSVVMALREPRALMLLALAFGPYALFHLLLQETLNIRYALPVMPAVVWLIARGVASIVARPRQFPGSAVVPATIAAAPVVLLVALRAFPAGAAYGSEAHPAFQAIDAAAAAIAEGERPAALYSHYSLRRALQAAPPAGVRVVEPRRSYEWLDLVDYWVGGGRAPVWFFADPKRTDLALIDPRSQRERGRSLIRRYRWTVADRPELGGMRPFGVDWYRFTSMPGWFAAEGWSLTPETGGLAKATTMGVDKVPIDVYVRRRDGPMRIVVGVRDLAPSAGAATAFEMAIDGMVVDRWMLDPAKAPNDLRFIDLASGLPPGPGDLAHLSITARAATPGRPTPTVAVRQFDIQPAGTLIVGFGEGWHEAEHDPASGLSWRWTSERAILRVAPVGGIRLTLRGESPLRYFDAAPRLRVTAAGRDIATLQPDARTDFTWTVRVPAAAVADANGTIAIETDRVYLPGQAEGTGDTRRLGLRLFEVAVDGDPP
jgi:hypothetical protein